MSRPPHYSFQRYLLAKQDLDSRSLNRTVLDHLRGFCAQAGTLRTLELGAGVGTMPERLAAWRILTRGAYLGLDADVESTAWASERVPAWAARQGLEFRYLPDGMELYHLVDSEKLRIGFQAEDALDFCQRTENTHTWDLLIAHAFLDLFHLPSVLPMFMRALRPGGAFYFTLNFDGETTFEPHIDAALDDHILSLYHRSMDERQVNGMHSGDSHAGRHLFVLLPQAGGLIQAAGASDWVVFPSQGSYPGDEAYFLHHILHFFEQSLSGHPELDQQHFAAWLERRHSQVERGELVYIAHQMDFFGLMDRE